jgi:DMSO/TMAO reductase YedYZ molybdopterin-dependent catalytic subunit
MNNDNNSGLTRRSLLRQTLLCASSCIWSSNHFRFPGALLRRSVDQHGKDSMLGLVPFSDEGHPPMGEPIGTELDGRLFTDLSTLTPENSVTAIDNFFVRTSASKLLNSSDPWTIRMTGLVEKPTTISAESLAKMARSMGTHLMECSGNTKTAHFGMMSAAAWHGVPLEEILEMSKPRRAGVRVLVSGFDRYQEESMTSEPGASWIFTPDDLSTSKAFLATEMNGQPLRADHGAPVRLLVPGWYGCVCVKWVNQIEFVSGDAPATSQMQEYASRTMQEGVPALARDYKPAVVDVAAMPTRIEKWLIGGKIRYHVMGLQWGGFGTSPAMEIRLGSGEKFVPVHNIAPSPAGNWSFWNFDWSPPRTGTFAIRLRPSAANVTARRLDSGYYDRSVDIAEI